MLHSSWGRSLKYYGVMFLTMKFVYSKCSCILFVVVINRNPFHLFCSSTAKHVLPQLTWSGQWSTTQWKGRESAVLFCSPFGKPLGTYLQQRSPGFQHTQTGTNDRKVQIKYTSHLLLGFGFCTKHFKHVLWSHHRAEWSLGTLYKQELKLRVTSFRNEKVQSYGFPVYHH